MKRRKEGRKEEIGYRCDICTSTLLAASLQYSFDDRWIGMNLSAHEAPLLSPSLPHSLHLAEIPYVKEY